jgi:hypothetical protein
MRALRWIAIAALVYVGIVVAFESLIGYFQPAGGSTLVITTFDAGGALHDRVVSRLESDGQLYVAANHWPRAWYERALANPEVQVTFGGEKRDLRAVPVEGAEHERVDAANRLPLWFRFVTGFPRRLFVRLDPRQVPAS